MATTTTTNGIILKQSTAYRRSFYYGTTGQTVTVALSKNGGSFASAAGGITEIANGWYYVALTTVDTASIGDLAYYCTASLGGPANFNDQVASQIFTDLQLNVNGRAYVYSNVQTNAAISGFSFLMTSTATGQPAPGLAVTAQRSLGGTGFSPCANSPTEISNGIYSINLAAADTNSALIMLRFTAPTANDLNIMLATQP